MLRWTILPRSFGDTNFIAWRKWVSPSLISHTLTICPPLVIGIIGVARSPRASFVPKIWPGNKGQKVKGTRPKVGKAERKEGWRKGGQASPSTNIEVFIGVRFAEEPWTHKSCSDGESLAAATRRPPGPPFDARCVDGQPSRDHQALLCCVRSQARWCRFVRQILVPKP